MLDYQKLIHFFDEYISHYHTLLKFESEKLRLIAADNIEELNQSIGREQAFIMKTNAFETRRLELLGAENKGKDFRKIVEEAPAEFKGALDTRYRDLSKVVFQIKKINANTQEIVSKRLENFDAALGSVPTYDKSGTKSHAGREPMTLNKDI